MLKNWFIKLLNWTYFKTNKVYTPNEEDYIQLPNGINIDMMSDYAKDIHSVVEKKTGFHLARMNFGRITVDKIPLQEPRTFNYSEDNSQGEWEVVGSSIEGKCYSLDELTDEEREFLGL